MWFVVGVGLILVGLVAGVALFIWTLAPFFSTDARVPADGRPHVVEVGTDGDRMLWHDDDLADPGCRLVDQASGRELSLRPVDHEFTRATPRHGDLIAAYRFAPGSGHLEVTCSGPVADDDGFEDVVIGPAPNIRSFVGGLIATIAVAAFLGLLGLVTLIVTGVLWTIRPARPKS